MSQPVLLKAYGNFWPATAALASQLGAVLVSCLPAPDTPPARLAGTLLLISFEGLYFPVDEVICLLERSADVACQGKLDILDLENWQMTRYLLEAGKFTLSHALLNNVLAYSGH